MGMLEDLRDEVDTLRKMVGKLCARTGHDEWESAYPFCQFHRHEELKGYSESCATCGEFRCCAEVVYEQP